MSLLNSCFAVLLLCHLPQLVLDLRLAAVTALAYIILKTYTYMECMLVFPDKGAQTGLATTGLVLGVSNWSAPPGDYV